MDETKANCKETILVVDDDRSALEIVRHILEKEGFNTLCAQNGEECLQFVRQQHVDVILLDVVMPGMDGLEVCARLRASERGRGIPVILLTASDDMKTRKAGMHLGVSEFITKPLARKELLARIRAQLHVRTIEHKLDNLLGG